MLNLALWQNIVNYDFDQPFSEYGFSIRLANENFWTKKFTQQAILEYKKFMYLAAISNQMVSPSPVVDTVWHLHLIFTKEYASFCKLLGKTIEHVPSTHNREEREKFILAKERTRQLYKNEFGNPVNEIWENATIFESLALPKAKLKIRSFIINGIVIFFVLLMPVYFLLKPVFIHINNPQFLFYFILTSVVIFICLELWNKNKLKKLLESIADTSYFFYLHPAELIYLKTEKLDEVIHDSVDILIQEDKIFLREESVEIYIFKHEKSPESHQILNTLKNNGKLTTASCFQN